jgi:hypothetical protein
MKKLFVEIAVYFSPGSIQGSRIVSSLSFGSSFVNKKKTDVHGFRSQGSGILRLKTLKSFP